MMSEPCMNSAGPSMTIDPPTVTPWWSTDTRTSTTNATTSAVRVSATWMKWRWSRGANASTSTPMSAAPTTTSIGATAA